MSLSGSSPFLKPLLKSYEAFLVPSLILFILGNGLIAAFPGFLPGNPAVGQPLILILLGLALYGVRQPEKRRAFRLALWLVALLAGCLAYEALRFHPASNDVGAWAPASHAEIRGIVTGRPVKRRVIVTAQAVNGQPAVGQIQVILPFDASRRFGRTPGLKRDNSDYEETLEAGQGILITGDLALPFHSAVPGAFNQRAFLAGQGITAVLIRPNFLRLLALSDDWPYPLQRLTDRLKHRISETFHRILPSPQSEILGGLVLGDKAIPVDRTTRQAFIDTGLIHLLAASGVNVGIVAGATYGLLAFLKTPYRIRITAAMAAVCFYSLLTGLPPSIQRATTMLELALFLKLLNRELSGVFLLCLTSALLVLIHPENVASVGFQFSVLTTFGLLTLMPPLQELLGYYITRWLAGVILAPAVAQLWIWPLSVAYFNRFPLHTIPFNILALVLIAPLTLLGFTSALVSLGAPQAAAWLIWPARPLLDFLLTLARWGEGMRWAQWSLPSPSPWQIGVMYGGLFLSPLLLTRMKAGPGALSRRFPRYAPLLGLLPVLFLLSGLCSEKFQTGRQTKAERLPLSTERQAWLIKPAGADDRLLLLPEHLNYGESRSLADYLRHCQFRTLRLVVLLPEEAPARLPRPQRPEDFHDRNHIKAALSNIRIERLLISAATSTPNGLNVGETHVFPETGLRLRLANLRLEGTPHAFRLVSGPYPLLSMTSSDRVLLAEHTPLDGDERYYQLVQEGDRLSIRY